MSHKHPKQDRRADVDRLGRTDLHYAASDGDVTLVRALLAQGTDPNGADANGWTALHFACQARSPEVVRHLLQAGADVDPRDSFGNTPLSRATFESRGDGTIIGLLRAAGADPYLKNQYGISPLSLARCVANYNVRQFFNDLPEITPA